MIKKIEQVFAREAFGDVRRAYIARARVESGRVADARKWMIDSGFELCAVSDDTHLTDDGREILRAHGKAWVLRPDIHAQRLAEAIEHAKQRDSVMHSQNNVAAANNQPATCAALIDGQLCGGELSRKPICPKHYLWIYGVREILTCDVCGAQTAVMR